MVKTAGLGTRLAPFTDITPKPLLPLFGIPMLQFVADWIVSEGATKVVCNVHHLPDVFSKGVKMLDWGRAELKLSDESDEILGSAGGIRQAIPMLDSDPFLICNADVVCHFDLKALFAKHEALKKKHGVLMTLALMPIGSEAYPEIEVGKNSLVTGIGARKTQGLFYTGVAVCERQAFMHLPAGKSTDMVKEVFHKFIPQTKVGMHEVGGIWADIGTPELWRDAHFLTPPPEWDRRLEHPRLTVDIDDEDRSVRYGEPPYPDHWRGPGIGYGDHWVKLSC